MDNEMCDLQYYNGDEKMSEFVRKNICEGVAFSSVTDDRFKIGRQSATLIVPLSSETAAANALLSCVLSRSCREYPDFTALSKKLDSLYGAALYPSVRKAGENQMITIAVSGIEDRYAFGGESVSHQLARLLCSIIFDPDMIDGCFREENVEQERRQLIETIDSELGDKRQYAMKRCIEIMCRDELYSVSRYGSRQQVEALTDEDLYRAWENLKNNARTELFMLGSTSPEMAYEGFRAQFEDKPRKPVTVGINQMAARNVEHYTETEDLAQSKLVMGLRCLASNDSRTGLENALMSAVLGGTPTSKLFLNVREKQSLCYYCMSSVQSSKGIMLIDSGVETENIEKTEKAVLEQLSLLQNGDITAEELENAKLAVRNSLLSSLDSLAALQAYYTGGILTENFMSPAEAAEYVGSITAERIIELAQKVQLDTVFSLVGN